MAAVTPLVVPQVNVNDETVRLAGWSVPDGATVAAGDVVCDVETTKAASEITADVGGVLVHSASVDDQVAVGAVIGAEFGTRFSAKLRGEQLRALLGVIILAVGLKILVDLFLPPFDLFSLAYAP